MHDGQMQSRYVLAASLEGDRRTCQHAGVPLVADFAHDEQKSMTRAQRDWLRSTRLQLRSVSFHPRDQTSTVMWEQVCCPGIIPPVATAAAGAGDVPLPANCHWLIDLSMVVASRELHARFCANS